MIRKILLLLVADARAPTFHRASVALRAYPAVEPPDLRVKGVQGAEGVFEMTWADDGRATFEHGSAVHAEETPTKSVGKPKCVCASSSVTSYNLTSHESEPRIAG